jgi:hypothetical protein
MRSFVAAGAGKVCMKPISASTRERIAGAMQDHAKGGELSCARAFEIAEELGVGPLEMGRVADEAGVRFIRCQLGLFGYTPSKSIVEPAEDVSPELEQLMRDALILGRVPCAAAWAIASHLGIGKLEVSGAADRLGIRIGQCQLGGF